MKKRAKFLILILSAVAVLAASPWIFPRVWLYAGSAYGKIDEWRYQEQDAFHSEEWKEGNRKTRFTLVSTLIEGNVLTGKTQDAIERILGNPDRIGKDGIWHYETERPGWRSIDFSGGGLAVGFDSKQTVDEVTDTRWVD